jgi:hypothetical protein
VVNQSSAKNDSYGITSEAEKLLGSNDKVSVQALWKATPAIDFPLNLFGERINLDELQKEITEKADLLKEKIEKRKKN